MSIAEALFGCVVVICGCIIVVNMIRSQDMKRTVNKVLQNLIDLDFDKKAYKI